MLLNKQQTLSNSPNWYCYLCSGSRDPSLCSARAPTTPPAVPQQTRRMKCWPGPYPSEVPREWARGAVLAGLSPAMLSGQHCGKLSSSPSLIPWVVTDGDSSSRNWAEIELNVKGMCLALLSVAHCVPAGHCDIPPDPAGQPVLRPEAAHPPGRVPKLSRHH